MKRKVVPLLISLVLVLLFAAPVLADTKVQVNGDNLSPAVTPVVKNEVVFVQLDTVSRIMGADINVKYDRYITLVKNDNILKLSVEQTTATVNGKPSNADGAPYIDENNQIFVPLAFVWESLGGEAEWYPNTNTICLFNEETRDGMTAEEVLVKSSQKAQEFNSYTTTGDITMDMKMIGIDDPSFPGQFTMDMDITGYYQKNPLAFYAVQNMKMAGIPDMPEEVQSIKIESLYKDNTSYANMPEIGWVKTEIPDADFEALIQQSMVTDPTAILKQLDDFGITACFGNDTTIGGNDYWTINVNMDMEKYFEQLSQMIPMTSMAEGMDMATMFKDSQFDIFARSYIDKDNFLSTLTEFDCTINMKLPNPEATASDQNLEMQMKMTGTAVIDDFNVPCQFPDVSSAKDLSEIVPAETAEESN